MIGHVYPVYKEILINRTKEYNQKHNFKVNDFAAIEEVSMRDIFEILKINNLCCRSQMMGFVSAVPVL